MAITMLPTMTARKTIITGSSSEVMSVTVLSPSSSHVSAIFISISGNAPVWFSHVHHAADNIRKYPGPP